MKLEDVGKLISEAIALKSQISSKEAQIKVISNSIDQNKKEITRLNGLIEANDELESKRADLKADVAQMQDELAKRDEKLKKEGASIPFDKPSGGIVSI